MPSLSTHCHPVIRLGLGGLVIGLSIACQPISAETAPSSLDKITFDLSQLDDQGLYGPADGKRSLDYEFCLPTAPSYAEAVMAIDPSLTLYPQGAGRIGCTHEQTLAIGNTHQPNAQLVLMELANQDYIHRIDPVYWE